MESLSKVVATARSSKAGNRVKVSKTEKKEPARVFSIFVADRDVMSSNLLATALSKDKYYLASAIPAADLLRLLDLKGADMVILGVGDNKGRRSEFDLSEAVKRANPDMPIILLLNQSTRDSVMNAFRSGARGVFSRQDPISSLLDCVERVRNGYIWAGAPETTFLLDAIRSLPFPSLSPALLPLAYREQQVVQLAARGKSNRVIAHELALSEHTVKNYLYRAFEKLGVSNRVELLFYLSTRGQEFGATATENGDTGSK